jgi:hypothetical protein
LIQQLAIKCCYLAQKPPAFIKKAPAQQELIKKPSEKMVFSKNSKTLPAEVYQHSGRSPGSRIILVHPSRLLASGFVESSSFTVAGAAADFHRFPF